MLNSVQSVAELVHRLAVGSPIQAGKKWPEGEEAYLARPFASTTETTTASTQPVNNG
ncbi:hypothetical protein ABNP34_01095 [Glutamicibacter mishrai]|uniref:hypothetical protein n=1 Tax=Glutamicibacter mishrai TaxID=1775880 RepID=UPI0032EF1245